MAKKQLETFLCQICKEQKKLREVMPAELVREAVVETIRKTYPDWSSSGFICISDLNQFRANYVKNVLENIFRISGQACYFAIFQIDTMPERFNSLLQ